MSIYDGVVTLDQTDVPVIVELNDDYIRLSASGTEIGSWTADECQIAHLGESAYSITAEDETLHFVPNQPRLFAAAVNGAVTMVTTPAPHPVDELPVSTAQTVEDGAPPPKPLTMGLFYGLCVTTAVLAVWALLSIAL